MTGPVELVVVALNPVGVAGSVVAETSGVLAELPKLFDAST
jgi:hypothetical protein